jgi:hypothetical protein
LISISHRLPLLGLFRLIFIVFSGLVMNTIIYPIISKVLEEKSLILHKQLKLKEPNEVILYSVFLHPEYCALSDKEGNYPIHLAVSNAYPINVIEAIIEAYPEAVKLSNSSFKSTPLHLAMPTSFDVVKKLVCLYPFACSLPDKVGKYPLHQFCTHKMKSIDNIRILIKMSPTIVHKNDNFGRRPWDIAQSQFDDDETSRLLLNADPKGLSPSEYKLYRDANWKARKAIMRVIAKLTCSFILEVPKQYSKSSDARLIRLVIQLSQLPDHEDSGRKLLQYFFLIHPYSKTVTNKYLQNIVSYL